MKLIIHNSCAFGDCLLGTHLAKFLKRTYNNPHITFLIESYATLTTIENDPSGINQMAEIFLLQEGIDTVAILKDKIVHYIVGKKIPETGGFSKVYRQYGWYSNLGIIRSMFSDYFAEGFSEHDTETDFWFGKKPIRSKEKLHIATSGPLDWNRKYGNEFNRKQILAYLTSLKNVEVHEFGIDIKKQTYLQALQEMQNCHLYIGPAGSMGHAAAGIGMDTIVLCEVFPSENLSPEGYHSGYHKSIVATKENHCGDYKCITPKNFELPNFQQTWGNPTVEWGKFWVQECKYMPSGKSCIASVMPEQFIKEIDNWYNFRAIEWLK